MRHNVIKVRILSFFFLLFMSTVLMNAQVSMYIADVQTPVAKEGEPSTLSVRFTQQAVVQKAFLYLRPFGESEFKELEMLMSGRTAVVTIPSRFIIPPYVEYYIGYQIADGMKSYPEENPEGNPLKITVRSVDSKDNEIRILSPEPGETLPQEEVVVAISLLYASDVVDKTKTKIYLNNIDVTNYVIFSDEVLLFNPTVVGSTIDIGTQNLLIQLYDNKGSLYHSKSVTFNVMSKATIEKQRSSFQSNGSVQLEARNEYISSQSTTYLRGDIQITGSYSFLNGGVDLHLTNEDKPTVQPQNRYRATLQIDEYARIQLGDAYPQFPSLLISGKRVRGLTGSLTLGFFNVDLSIGQTERAIEGKVLQDTTYVDSSAAASRPKESLPLGGLKYRLFEAGTYKRNILAIRPSFGNGENFQWGISFTKMKDDVGSIQYGVYPKENLVVGTDILLAFDDQKIRWFTQVAFSISNTDISSGNLSDAAIDSIKGVYDPNKTPDEVQKAKDEAETLKKIAKIARSFITVNEFITPLDPITKLPSSAFETEFTLNYFNNFIRVYGFRRGRSYLSFGNDFIQTDVQGINISDRIRLFSNKLLLSIAYETKTNNTAHEASSPTTRFNTFTSSITAFPGVEYPSMTVGYGYNTRQNDVSLSQYYQTNKPLLPESLLPTDATIATLYQNRYTVVPDNEMFNTADEITNRYFTSLNYDFQFYGRQNANLTVSYAEKNDRTFYKRNQDNLNISTSVTTTYTIPLQTTVGFVVSTNSTYLVQRDTAGAYLNTTTKVPFNYQTITLSGRYRMLNNKLNIIATVAPSFGDFRRFLIQSGADYEAWINHVFTLEVSLFRYPGKSTDVLAGLLYRFIF